MKKFWEIPLILAICLCLCQCGSLPGGKENKGAGWDDLETVGDAESASVDSPSMTSPVDGRPPTDVKVDERLDAAVMIVNVDGEKRTMVIELNSAAAPQTVLNFKRNVARGFYDGLAFHRVIPNYVVQTGDPLTRDETNRSNWGTGGPGYSIPGEPGSPHLKGAVAMARLNDSMNPNRESSGSQFYICLRSLSKLDGDYTVFGNVTQGLDVLTALSKVKTDEDDIPNQKIVVETMKLVSSKSKFVRDSTTKKKPASSKPEKEKGGFEKLIERVW